MIWIETVTVIAGFVALMVVVAAAHCAYDLGTVSGRWLAAHRVDAQ